MFTYPSSSQVFLHFVSQVENVVREEPHRRTRRFFFCARRVHREKRNNELVKRKPPFRKMPDPRGGKKGVTEGRGTERGKVWTSNGTGGMTNQLLVVQLGPHTQHRYYRDHYLSPATPLPRQRREGSTKSHDARLQIRLQATSWPPFSMEINCDLPLYDTQSCF